MEKIRRDSGNGPRGRPVSSTKRTRGQPVPQQEIKPAKNKLEPPLGEKNNGLWYEIRPEPQAQLSTVEDAPEAIDDGHNIPDIMDYPDDPGSLLQTPPDSTKEDKDDFLFEPHAICMSFALRFLQR